MGEYGGAGTFPQVQRIAHGLGLALIAALALIAVGSAGLALAGVLPWIGLEASWNGAPLPDAGMWVQIALAVLALALLFYLPAHGRVARLERSHRSFRIDLADVARAYHAAHAADRAGTFALSAEYDAMRERIEHLRRHPDLGHLEPELLDLAAQMSHASRDLARVYSDEKVARAKTFLEQRQQETAAFRERMAAARQTCDALKTWLQDVEADERQAAEQFRRLEADLREILPALGYDVEDTREANVLPMRPQK